MITWYYKYKEPDESKMTRKEFNEHMQKVLGCDFIVTITRSGGLKNENGRKKNNDDGVRL